jgi:hypothetical protein
MGTPSTRRAFSCSAFEPVTTTNTPLRSGLSISVSPSGVRQLT